MNNIKQYLAALPAVAIWLAGLFILVIATTMITLLINPVMIILTLPVVTGVSIYIFSESIFKSVDPDTLLVTKNVVDGSVGFLPAGLNILHPFKPLTGEEVSLKIRNIFIPEVILDCYDGVRLKTGLNIAYHVDSDNARNFYVQTPNSIEIILKQKISSMMSFAKDDERMTSDYVTGEGQEEIILAIQNAFDNDIAPDLDDPKSVARQLSALKAEKDTGTQVLRVDLGDLDYADQSLVEAKSRKVRAKLLGDTINTLKDFDQKDINNALVNEGKAQKIIIEGGSGVEAALLMKAIGGEK